MVVTNLNNVMDKETGGLFLSDWWGTDFIKKKAREVKHSRTKRRG